MASDAVKDAGVVALKNPADVRQGKLQFLAHPVHRFMSGAAKQLCATRPCQVLACHAVGFGNLRNNAAGGCALNGTGQAMATLHLHGHICASHAFGCDRFNHAAHPNSLALPRRGFLGPDALATSSRWEVFRFQAVPDLES